MTFPCSVRLIVVAVEPLLLFFRLVIGQRVFTLACRQDFALCGDFFFQLEVGKKKTVLKIATCMWKKP